MGFYLLLLLFGGLLLFWFVLNNPAPKSAAVLITAGPIILMAVGALLTFFRRGMIGMPLLFIGLSWWRRNRSMRPADYSGGQKSTVRSADLEMELDHDTGDIDGRVLTGQLKGTLLSSLGEEELFHFIWKYLLMATVSPYSSLFLIATTQTGGKVLILILSESRTLGLALII